MNFEFVSAGRIVFGAGRAQEAGALARPFGARCLLIRGRSAGAQRVRDSLTQAGLEVAEMPGPPREPDEADVDIAVPLAKAHRPDVVVAVGGGSVLDFAKAVAALAPQEGDAPVRDYLEGVGRGLTLQASPIPVIACPTTAGTGSEVTKNAVISSKAGKFKKSLRDPRMVPAVALVDPELQAGAPRNVRVWSGLDALTQCIEAFVSRKATAMTRPLALAGMKAAGVGLSNLGRGGDEQAQASLAYAALLSGLALANSGLGAAHGIAQSLGIYGVPHGLACAVALPWTIAWNAKEGAGGQYGPVLHSLVQDASYEEYTELAQQVVGAVTRLMRPFDLPCLSELPALYPDLPPLDEEGIATLARGARGNSLSGNPVEMSDADVADLLRRMRDADGPEALLPSS